jgi:hypothetical protein
MAIFMASTAGLNLVLSKIRILTGLESILQAQVIIETQLEIIYDLFFCQKPLIGSIRVTGEF